MYFVRFYANPYRLSKTKFRGESHQQKERTLQSNHMHLCINAFKLYASESLINLLVVEGMNIEKSEFNAHMAVGQLLAFSNDYKLIIYN